MTKVFVIMHLLYMHIYMCENKWTCDSGAEAMYSTKKVTQLPVDARYRASNLAMTLGGLLSQD